MTVETDQARTEFRRTTLDCGMRVVTGEMPHTRSVSIGLYVGVGSRNESDDIAGISHLVEHLVFKGTPKRPAALRRRLKLSGYIRSW
mgnify:CR=1 FL=1